MTDFVFLVVGAGSGIGRALVSALEGQEQFVLWTARQIGSRQGDRGIEWDLNDSVPPLLLEAVRGRRVICVITVGHPGKIQKAGFPEKASLESSFRDNALLPLVAISGLARAVSRESAFIVLSGGGVGGQIHQPDRPYYVSAKTYLVAAIEEFAELNPLGPSIFAVAPGYVDTGFSDSDDRRRIRKHLSTGNPRIEELQEFLGSLDTRVLSSLSGRLVSARWDKAVLSNPASLNGEFGKLRRVVSEE